MVDKRKRKRIGQDRQAQAHADDAPSRRSARPRRSDKLISLVDRFAENFPMTPRPGFAVELLAESSPRELGQQVVELYADNLVTPSQEGRTETVWVDLVGARRGAGTGRDYRLFRTVVLTKRRASGERFAVSAATVLVEHAAASRRVLHILTFVTHRDEQRCGHGTTLATTLKQLAKALGCADLFVSATPDVADGFYAAVGFGRVGRDMTSREPVRRFAESYGLWSGMVHLRCALSDIRVDWGVWSARAAAAADADETIDAAAADDADADDADADDADADDADADDAEEAAPKREAPARGPGSAVRRWQESVRSLPGSGAVAASARSTPRIL